MATPTHRVRPSLNERLGSVQRDVVEIKGIMSNALSALAAGPVSTNQVIGLAVSCSRVNNALGNASNHAGLVPYAKDIYNDQTLNYNVEIAATVSALTDVITSINAALPKDVEGNILGRLLDASGAQTFSVLTTLETASIQTNLTTAIATID